jgi:uncharacterized protein (DUF1778 family)
MVAIVGGWRNTVRSVVPVRLSVQERGQIARAAGRLELSRSGFVRQAALQASAVVERKTSVKAPEPEPRGLVVVGPEPSRHLVDGEWIERWAV